MLAVALLIALGAAWLLWHDRPATAADWGLAAQRGDYWSGHLAAATSLISAVLFFVAIMLQKEELQSQREELALTREEMKQARAVSETQAQQLKRQTEIAEHSALVNGILEVISLRSRFEGELAGLRRIAADDDQRVTIVTHQLDRTLPYLLGLLTQLKDEGELVHLARAGDVVRYFGNRWKADAIESDQPLRTPNLETLEGMLADVVQLKERVSADLTGVRTRAGELLVIAMKPENGLFREGKYAALWSTIEVAKNSLSTGKHRAPGEAVFLVAVSWWLQEVGLEALPTETDRAGFGLDRMRDELVQRIALLKAINTGAKLSDRVSNHPAKVG